MKNVNLEASYFYETSEIYCTKEGKISMKNVCCLLLAIILAISLIGCKKAEAPEFSEPTTVATETTESTEATETTEVAALAEEDATVHVHQWQDTVTAPDCTSQGYTTHTCKLCGEVEKDNYTDAVGHKWGAWETVQEATTTATGLAQQKCSVCGKTQNRTIDKLPTADHKHSYKSTVTTEPTCSQTGVKTFTCSCGDTYTETIPKTNHNYKSTVVKPTCTTRGYTEYKCECGNSYKDNYTATVEHTYRETVVAPTCTEKGYTRKVCKDCGDTRIVDEVKASGHSTELRNAKESTCSEAGYSGDEVCTKCQQTVKYGQALPLIYKASSWEPWDFDEFTEVVLPPKPEWYDSWKEKQTKKSRKKEPLQLRYTTYNLFQDRMHDLEKLQTLGWDVGYREKMVFLYRLSALQSGMTSEEALKAALEFNSAFATPLLPHDVEVRCKPSNPNLKYKNSTIRRELDLDDRMHPLLFQSSSETQSQRYQRRKEEKIQSGALVTKQQRLEETYQQIIELKGKGKKQKEIEELLNIPHRTMTRHVKTLKERNLWNF